MDTGILIQKIIQINERIVNKDVFPNEYNNIKKLNFKSMITIRGQLLNKGEYTSPTRTLTKRIFIVTDITQEPSQRLPFELLNDRCELIDEYEVGDELLIQFKIRSVDWLNPEGKSKLIVSLIPVRIEKIDREYMI